MNLEESNLPILVSVSGGRTSAFMAVYLKTRYPHRKFLFVFANTGKEREETLLFLQKLDKNFELGLVWLEAKVNPIKGKGTTYKKVNFITASRDGGPFYDVISKYGLPSKVYRHCTRELKQKPIHKYTKQILGKNYLTAIGIRSDEAHRISNKENFIYPLAEINIDKKFINDWWSRQSFNLELKEHEGNCDFCFLKSKNKRLLLIKEGLDVSWWNDIEIQFGQEDRPVFDMRNKISVEELVNLSSIDNLKTDPQDDVDFDCFCKST